MGAALGITGRSAGRGSRCRPRPSGGSGTVTPMTTETTMTRIQLGAMGEALAADHLMRMGFRIVARNWRCRYGELDIIARDDTTSTVVFVEVKTRTGDGYGGLAYAVTPRKVLRLRRLAGLWLAGQDQRCAAIRIDVIGVRVGRRRTPEITHLQGIG